MSRKICVVTATRAEFGLLRPLLDAIHADPRLELQLVVTGAHLSQSHGMTLQEIEASGYQPDRLVDLQLQADDPISLGRSVGTGFAQLVRVYRDLAPDVLVVLGDRYELLAIVGAALLAGLPVAHIHGGELTEGAFDDAIRHAVTKLSHLHFVAAPEYRRRVLQMGECPEHVWTVGALSADAIAQMPLLSRSDLELAMGLKFRRRNLLITYHPVTLEGADSSALQMGELLHSLSQLEETGLIFTMPNADPGSGVLAQLVSDFVRQHSNARLYSSLGHQRYLSCMRCVDAVVGNSSSGLIEAPAMGVATINIGNRQQGRLSADSVIHCSADRHAIRSALDKVFSTEFQHGLAKSTHPYSSPGAAKRIADVLAEQALSSILKKKFVDLNCT